MKFKAAEKFILSKLQNELSSDLHYHGIHHTMDVLGAVRIIASEENITGENLLLLETAALYHDAGFTETYQEHEAAGCKIARENLPKFGYSETQIEQICGMIMATKIPQAPQNHLEEILCDADLLYLGQDDFFRIGNTLFIEFKELGVLSTEEEWNRLQVRFMESHQYFTKTANAISASRKKEHLNMVKDIVGRYAA